MDLFAFTADPVRAAAVVRAGAAGVIVDWERRGKARRQAGQDTQINEDTPADLAAVRSATPGRVLCRVDAAGAGTAEEVDLAVALGADEVLLPMVRTPADVDLALEAVGGRCGLGILVETSDAVACVDALARRPLSRVYLGLNDLRIDRGSDALFAPLADGTAARVAQALAAAPGGPVPFGVAGLTLPERGRPVPSRVLAGELVRLGAAFTFLRRSFWADTGGRDLDTAVPRLQAACAQAARRTPAQVTADAAELRSSAGLVRVAQPA